MGLKDAFVHCLEGVVDMTGSGEGASMLKEPLKAWEDNVSFLGNLGREVFTFIRPLMDAMHTDAGKAGGAKLEAGVVKLKMAMGGRGLPVEALKLTDPTGSFLAPGELLKDHYRPDSEMRVDAFMMGKLGPDGLQGPLEKAFIAHKAEIIDDLEIAKQFSPSEVKPRRPFRITDDIKTPMLKDMQANHDVRVLPYDFSNNITKQMYVRLMKAPDGESVSFSEWHAFMYPQVKKQAIFNPIMKDVAENYLPKMSPAEQVRIGAVFDRLAAKQTRTQRIVDGWINWAREKSGKPKLEFSPSTKYVLGATRAFYRGTMWSNIGMPLVNMTQAINFAARRGPMNTMEGAVNFMGKEGRDLIRRSESALFGEFHPYFRGPQSTMGKIDESVFGFGFFNKSEYILRGWGMHAGLSEFKNTRKLGTLSDFMALEKTNPELFQEGIRHAMGATNDANFLYSVVSQSPLLTGPFSKLFLGQLMSYPINQAEFLWRGMKNDPVWFLPRWLALTGAASLATYYGLGYVMDKAGVGEDRGVIMKGMGGGAMLPIAIDMWNAGHEKDAMMAGGLGVVGFLPDRFGLERGLTPANGALLDIFRVFSSLEGGNASDISKAFASASRSLGNVIPAFVAARRATEAVMVQMYQHGKRYEPGSEGAGAAKSAMEGTGFVPLFNSVVNEYLGGSIPGVPTGQSGRFAHQESMAESVITGLGLRAGKTEMRTQEMDRLNSARTESISGRAAFADQLAEALEKKDVAGFRELVQNGVKGGLVAGGADLKAMLAGALEARNKPKDERLKERMPKVEKLRELQEEMARRRGAGK